DYDRAEQYNRPIPPNDPYYNGPPSSYPSGPSHGPLGRNAPPNEQMHPGEISRPYSPGMDRHPYDRRGDRPPPVRQNYDDDNWNRQWPDNRNAPDRYDYPRGPPPRCPPREPRPQHADFFPDPHHPPPPQPPPPNHIPPQKRPHPPGPSGQPPDHMRKYPRQDHPRNKPPWTGQSRW
ncbi:unnamed protein product, partial [Trichobilharzia regenti]